MAVLVSDTSVIIDLERGEILETVFALDVEFAVPTCCFSGNSLAPSATNCWPWDCGSKSCTQLNSGTRPNYPASIAVCRFQLFLRRRVASRSDVQVHAVRIIEGDATRLANDLADWVARKGRFQVIEERFGAVVAAADLSDDVDIVDATTDGMTAPTYSALRQHRLAMIAPASFDLVV
jgi:hypothetical protein